MDFPKKISFALKGQFGPKMCPKWSFLEFSQNFVFMLVVTEN